ncbi:hypothetical protein [Oleispirillum naphthae]|uniref:AbiTii domain-containing protein n=1 Tax=Oleispirillum naphthae TaxID=2838853 RepID=UPI0030824B23
MTTPIVIQLQSDVLDPKTSIADLLRKVKLVAVKLNLNEVLEWVERELNGYPDDATLPDYRELTGQVKFFNPYHGWRPVICEDNKMEEIISRCPVYQTIASIEEVLARSTETNYLVCPFPGQKQAILSKMMGFRTEFQAHVSPAAFFSILDSVRNRVLDWAISLEKAGILGDGLTFTPKEKEAAKVMTTGNVYHIQGNVGVLGDVAHSTVTNTQSATYSADQLDSLRNAIEQISAAVDQIEADLKEPVTAAIGEIQEELKEAQPNSGKLRTAIASIRATCEGAAGNLTASGILGLLAAFQ